MEDRTQQLLDELGAVAGELFATGLEQSSDVVKRSVLDGLNAQRVRICVELCMPPKTVTFGVVGLDGGTPIRPFEPMDPTAKPLRVDPLPPGSSDAIN